jgi:uncharacterized protein YecT (DUF1311 family)
MTVLGLCVAFAYAETDVQIESVTTSPRGTFRIEQERKQNAGKGEWTTTTWITLAADPSQRVPLDKPFGDWNHFFISPDEQWICAMVHEHSQLQSVVLYRRKTGLQFDLVAAEREDEDARWHFETNDRFAPKGDAEQDETGRVYNRFVAWSSDSARLLVERRSQLEAKGKDGSYLWSRHYFYFNLRRGKLERTPYLLTLNRAFRHYDSEQKKDVVPAFAEPLDALPPEDELQQRYEAAERRLNKVYPAYLTQADDEIQNPNEKRDRLRYQRLWLKAREAGAESFAAMGSKAERQRRKLLYLADATENRAHELEEYLEERARRDEENKKQATKANEAAKDWPGMSEEENMKRAPELLRENARELAQDIVAAVSDRRANIRRSESAATDQ